MPERPSLRSLLAGLAWLPWLCLANAAVAADAVTLQLKWAHAFQFAGYYAASELGYYRDAGLDVDIREAKPGLDIVSEVTGGRAQFGVGTSSLLLSRKAGQPVVALAVIVQHSPYVLIAAKRGDIQSIHDIAGRRVMLEPQSDELNAYLRREGIPLSRIQRVEHSFDVRDLIQGRTDAISAYVTNQPYDLDRARFPYVTYTPRSAGIDFYGDNLFTSEQQLREHPDRVKAFREASLRGWVYAMEHPEAVIGMIMKKYPDRHSADYLRFEAAQYAPLIRKDLVAIGYMNPGRWRHIADTYAEIGMLPRDFPLDGFLYDPDPQPDLRRLYFFLAIAIAAIGVVGAVALYTTRLNRNLERSRAELAATLEAIPDLLVEMDEAGNCLDVKTTHNTSPTISGRGLVGRNVRDFLPEAAATTLFAALEAARDAGSDYGRVIALPSAVGETHVELSVARKPGGVPARFVVLSRDVTARVAAEQQIRELNTALEQRVLARTAELATARAEAESANAVKTRFMSNVSHEMRTPLQGVIGFAALGLRKATQAEQADAADCFRQIADSGARMQKLVESLLALADRAWKEHARLSDDDLRDLDLADVVRECLVSMKKIADARQQVLVFENTAPMAVVRGDLVRLRQALEYLIGNALRYSEPGTAVTLSLGIEAPDVAASDGKHGTALVLRIIDEGCGIPPGELAAIFEPFYESSRTATGAGSTGLGLPLSRLIVERHGGMLTARNREEGGAVFEIRMPVAKRDA